MRGAIRAAGSPVLFDDESLARFQNRIELGTLLGGKEPPSGDAARHAVDLVRSVASAVVRYDLYDSAGQAALRDRYPALAEVETARGLLGDAVAKLSPMVTQLWSEPVRALAQAILEETQALVVGHGTVAAPLEARMLAQGTPLSYALRAELTADLARLRDWLLVRLESGVDLTDCATGPIVAGTVLPPGLPTQPPPGREHVGVSELGQAALAADRLDSALLRYVAGCVCASILPPCGDCADGDVLLAVVEVKDCAVVGICATGREQWLPGGPGYAAWAPKLYQARALAERVCCQPVTVAAPPDAGSADGPVQLDYVPQLLDHPASTELDTLLTLLAPKYGTPAPVDDASSELARLRAQVDQLAATVAGLTAAPPAAESPAESPAEAPPAEPEPTEAEEPEEPEEKRASPAPQKAAPHKAAAKATPQKRAKPAQSDDQES
jgi:hypothetical protein